jgi:hypothetical protein
MPFVPVDTPTLALLELLLERVPSVSVVFSTFTWFFAATRNPDAPAVVDARFPLMHQPLAHRFAPT